MRNSHPSFPSKTKVRRRRVKEVFISLQFGPSTKNSPFLPKNQKNFHSYQERKMLRRLWEVRISSWIQEMKAEGERKSR
ncbi:hypothetical protein F383_15841 [Gossypium arboreum]|uniref:Uncharacterized protein n=1 Tax=Gossypium arboreum TaxID=29729 RepID=A0A0B0NE34_GOSAR|nr:hypothetical protein F383_15841 [Gossypium arboreum]